MKKLLILLVAALCCYGAQSQVRISPASSAIKAAGRIDKSNPDRFAFDMPGITFEMKFKGSTSVAAILKGSRQTYFHAFINGAPITDSAGKQKLFSSNADSTIMLASNLKKNKEYHVVLSKRTENLDNIPSEFMGFVLDSKAHPLDAASLYKTRKIEVLGNSITCAFGVESKDKDSKFSAHTENSHLSYAMILARAFDADVQLTARSGRGVVRNYADKGKVATQSATVTQLFERYMESVPSKPWDFSFKPDLVIVNLGSNDYSTLPHPDKAVFIDTYLKLLTRIRTEYGPSIPILCVAPPRLNEDGFNAVYEMVTIQRTLYQDLNTHFVAASRALLVLDKDFGAAMHPGGDGQKKIAQTLAPTISSVTGWTYNRTEMDDIKGSQSFYSRE